MKKLRIEKIFRKKLTNKFIKNSLNLIKVKTE